MGNCHCRPREGGESLRGFLARKFHAIAGKRKIDDLVTIAIQDEGDNIGGADNTGKAGEVDDHATDIELLDLECETVFEDDYCPDSDGRASLNHKPLDKYQIYDNPNHETEEDSHEQPTRQDELPEIQDENDYIRTLQNQLQQVQSELANLQRSATTKGETVTAGINHGQSFSACSFRSQESDVIIARSGESRCERASPIETSNHRTPRNNFLHAHGDTRGNPYTQPEDNHNNNVLSAAVEKDIASARIVQMMGDDNGDTGGKVDKRPQNDGRRSKIKGMITEGLRTRNGVKLPRNKAQVTGKEKVQKSKTTRENNTVEDKARTAAKIATLQKRDPKLPGPDKGIVWPKTMENLSRDDKAYYVEQFLRSELFRQRCLRKYQGSKTWMNGLTPFHTWVLENEDTDEIEAVLHPLPKRHNNAQAKVRCWRGNTPPPQPKSE